MPKQLARAKMQQNQYLVKITIMYFIPKNGKLVVGVENKKYWRA